MIATVFLGVATVVGASHLAVAEPKLVDKTQLYGPVIGDWKSKKKSSLVFYWSGNQQSADAYRQIVSPLMQKEDRRIQLLLVQVLDKDVADQNGPGGLLLCPQKLHEYASLAIAYLKNGRELSALKPLPESEGRDVLFLTNATLDEAQKRGLFDPARCMGDDYYWARFVLRLGDSKKFFDSTPIQQLPQISINGEHMLPDDPRVARFVARARSTP